LPKDLPGRLSGKADARRYRRDFRAKFKVKFKFNKRRRLAVEDDSVNLKTVYEYSLAGKCQQKLRHQTAF
jgi:hypothetical protein